MAEGTVPQVSSAESLIAADMATRREICACRSNMFLAEAPPVHFTSALYYACCLLLQMVLKIKFSKPQYKYWHDASMADNETLIDNEGADEWAHFRTSFD